jgi:molybdate transport system substrate-binding protein
MFKTLLALILGWGAVLTAASALPLRVLAASSLTNVLPQVGNAWTKKSNIDVQFSFDATSRLAVQVEEEAPADVFFSADSDWMDRLEKRQLVDSSTRVDLLSNELVLIVPTKAISPPATLDDLRSSDVKKIALAGENVPVSKYARAAFERGGVWDMVQNKLVRGDNVRSILQWVAEGVADAGVVYRTDVKIEPRVKVAISFAPSTYPDITYPAAVVKKSKRAEDAKSFLAFCRSADARAIFKKAGFTPLFKK